MDAGTAQGRRGGRILRLRGASVTSLAIGLCWSFVYLALSTPRLDVPGLYYDEVHQAPAAFALTQAPHSSAAYRIAGVPVLNMPYSGAIKSTLYGIGLLAFDQPFTVTSWRLLGCLITAIGILWVCAAFASALSRTSAMVMGFLLVTDVTVLLATRHDWGPVALGLSFRLALLAIWIKDWARESPRVWASFGLGTLLGLAVFEKLSSAVLIIPFLVAFTADPRRRTARHWAAGVCGGLVGSLPLLGTNLHSWVTGGNFISLASGILGDPERPPLWEFLRDYEALGAGSSLMGWILGQPPLLWVAGLEGFSVGLASLAILGAVFASRPGSRVIHAAGLFVGLHLAIGFAVLGLPTTTWVHHWVIGTPFQYAAFAFAAHALSHQECHGALANRSLKWFFLPALTLIMFARIPSLVVTETAIQAGSTSPNFDPATLRLGEFAVRQPRDSVFLASEWGVSLQILCLSNGEIEVPEIYWDYSGRDDILRAVGDAPRFFLVAGRAGEAHPGQTDRILADARSLRSFRERPVGPEAAYWRTVRAWRFERR